MHWCKAFYLNTVATLFLLSPTIGFAQSALLVDQQIPDRMIAGEHLSISITLKNTGSAPWTTSNTVLTISNNNVWGLNKVSLGKNETIKAGNTKTFIVNIQAPTSNAHYAFGWELRSDNKTIAAFQDTILVETKAHRAQFISQLFPSHVKPGETFKAIIQYRNIGDSSWSGQSNDYALRALSAEARDHWGVDKVILEDQLSVLPNSVATFTFTVTAPNRPGSYPFSWEMAHNKFGSFGDRTPENTIIVGTPRDNAKSAKADAEFVSVHIEEHMVAGQEYDAVVIFKNIGETTWWAANTHLISENPQENLTWFINQVDYGSTGMTPPNDIHAFRFSVRAPEDAGEYNFQWRMFDKDKNSSYGEKSENVKVTVQPR